MYLYTNEIIKDGYKITTDYFGNDKNHITGTIEIKEPIEENNVESEE